MTSKEVSLRPLIDAHASLKDALNRVKDDLDRDGAIQRFEYTYELAWKTLKRYFQWNQNLEESNVKNLWREAGNQSLIENVETWFGFHEARNRTSHLYSKKVAEAVFKEAERFQPEVEKLLAKLESLLA